MKKIFGFSALVVAPLMWAAPRPPQIFSLSMKEAEERALGSSDQIKALGSAASAAQEQADAQSSGLYPRLSLDANYRYLTNVPKFTLPIPGAPEIAFGTHNNYTIGPTLSYTLWDTNATRNAARALEILAQARGEDKKNGELQLLFAVRSAYLRLQLSLEELRLLSDSLALARTQNHDIETNFKGGAATRLDRVDSQRELLSYRLQFSQKQTEVANNFKDLLALLKSETPPNFVAAGPPGVDNVSLQLNIDSLSDSLAHTNGWTFSPPTGRSPQLRSQELLAESAERQAQSMKATYFPTVQVSASAAYQYPNGAMPERIEQNTLAVNVSMPIFEGFRSSHLVAEKRMEAQSARFSADQLRTNLERDFTKGIEVLQSLRLQQKLAQEDVQRSQDAAKLYYQSYRGGRLNLTDVESANNRALLSQVNSARINAQTLSQLYLLRSISDEEISNGR